VEIRLTFNHKGDPFADVGTMVSGPLYLMRDPEQMERDEARADTSSSPISLHLKHTM
jgi:hypothetical protein